MGRSPATESLRLALTEALGSIEDELGRAKALVADASCTLVESFRGMKDQIEAQQVSLDQAAQHLLRCTREGESGESLAFAEAMTLLVQRFVDELVRVGVDGMKLVDRFETLTGHVNEIVSRVNGIDRLTRQTRFVALSANIEARRVGEKGATFMLVADEVKTLADNSARINDQIRQVVSAARASMDEARATITQLASHDMGVAIDSKGRMTEAMSAFEALSVTANETLRKVSEHASHAIANLQVEDLLGKLIASTTQKVEILGLICQEIMRRMEGHEAEVLGLERLSDDRLRQLSGELAATPLSRTETEDEIF